MWNIRKIGSKVVIIALLSFVLLMLGVLLFDTQEQSAFALEKIEEEVKIHVKNPY